MKGRTKMNKELFEKVVRGNTFHYLECQECGGVHRFEQISENRVSVNCEENDLKYLFEIKEKFISVAIFKKDILQEEIELMKLNYSNNHFDSFWLLTNKSKTPYFIIRLNFIEFNKVLRGLTKKDWKQLKNWKLEMETAMNITQSTLQIIDERITDIQLFEQKRIEEGITIEEFNKKMEQYVIDLKEKFANVKESDEYKYDRGISFFMNGLQLAVRSFVMMERRNLEVFEYESFKRCFIEAKLKYPLGYLNDIKSRYNFAKDSITPK